jgi:hypothetical protein
VLAAGVCIVDLLEVCNVSPYLSQGWRKRGLSSKKAGIDNGPNPLEILAPDILSGAQTKPVSSIWEWELADKAYSSSGSQAKQYVRHLHQYVLLGRTRRKMFFRSCINMMWTKSIGCALGARSCSAVIAQHR